MLPEGFDVWPVRGLPKKLSELIKIMSMQEAFYEWQRHMDRRRKPNPRNLVPAPEIAESIRRADERARAQRAARCLAKSPATSEANVIRAFGPRRSIL